MRAPLPRATHTSSMSHEPAEWDVQETLIARLRREAVVRDEELAALRARLDVAEHELDDLRAIQDALTPPELPRRPGLELAAAFLPAHDERLSGDFYLVAEGPQDSTVLVIGDVVGHGLQAGRRAAFVRTTFAATAPFSDDPGRLLSWANTALVERAGTSSEFVTAACVTFHPDERILRWAYAGHPPALWMHDSRELAAPRQGPPLGLDADPEYEEGSIRLRDPAGVLLYTDGLTEARRDQAASSGWTASAPCSPSSTIRPRPRPLQSSARGSPSSRTASSPTTCACSPSASTDRTRLRGRPMILGLLLALASAAGHERGLPPEVPGRGARTADPGPAPARAAPPGCSAPSGSRSGGWSRSSPGSCTSGRSRSRRCRSCRRCSPADWCSSPSSPSASSTSSSDAGNGSASSITAAGLAVIGLTGGGSARPQRSSLAALIAVEGAIFAVGAALLAISAHRRVLHRAEGMLLGLAAGALFGVSDVAIKYLTHAEGPLPRAAEPMDADRPRGRGDRLLRLRPQPPTRAAGRGHRPHLGGRQPGRHPRRHPRLRRTRSAPAHSQIGARFIAFCLVIVGAALMPTHAEQLEAGEDDEIQRA